VEGKDVKIRQRRIERKKERKKETFCEKEGERQRKAYI